MVGYFDTQNTSEKYHILSLTYEHLGVYTSNLTTSYNSTAYMLWGKSTTNYYGYMKKSSDGKTIYWYGNSASYQDYLQNITNCVYVFLAFA